MSENKRMVKALGPLVITLAWIFQLLVTLCGNLWSALNEELYPLGVYQVPPFRISTGVLVENIFLVLLASFCLELLDTLITRRLNQTISFSLPLKTILLAILSLSHLMIRGEGLFTFYPLSLFLITAALIAYVNLKVEQHFSSFEEDVTETIELERFLSLRDTVTLSVLLFVFYTRSFPFIILTRFASALLMLGISLVSVFLTIGIGFHFARELTNSFSIYLTEKQSEYLQLGVVMIFALEISWALTPIPPLVPVVILFSWSSHKALSNRWPKRFGREVITVGKRGSIRGYIPNLKAICLCVMLIIGPTLVYNEILGVASPSVILSDTRIAIIDDGINTETSILREHVVAARSFVDTSLGYTETNPDPLPETLLKTSHATLIALTILDIYPGASLINARIRDSNNDITKIGFEEAVRWCVNEENASIISLSFGDYIYDLEDGRYDEILDWAWNRGVLIVASAGNDNQASWTQGGLGNVVYPGANLKVMAVGATNSSGQVHPNSGRGPVHTGVLKPDILAPGYLYDNDLKWGTSFAAPRVAAAAAMIIDALNEARIPWTPGLLRAAMVSSATDTGVPSYAQGGGLVDVEATLSTIINAPRNQDDLPLVMSTLPSSLPLDFEILFAGVNHSARISVFCSTLLNISLEIPSSLQGVVAGGDTRINQCGYIDLYLTPTNSSTETLYEDVVTIACEMVSTSIDVSFNAPVPKARLAIDTSHDGRNWYSTYLLFLQYTRLLNQNDIAVTEIRNPEDFCESKLAIYDGLVILNPYSSWYGGERRFNEQDQLIIEQYVANGGSLLLAVSGDSNRTATNLLLNWTGISLQEGTSWSSDLNLTEHPITEGVTYPDDSYYEEHPYFSTFNTTSEYTWVMSFPRFFTIPPEAIIVCGEIPSRVAAIGKSEWFQNNQLLDVDTAEAMLVINLTNWVLGS